MSVEQTQQVIQRYFEVMGAEGDFSEFYVEGVTWVMVDTGFEVRGRSAVRHYVVALHSQMSDGHTRSIVVSDGAAYVEGDCINSQQTDAPRISYCVAFDLTDDRITAMRCYGNFGAMTAQIEPADS
jgi:hypothetical protein